MSNTWRMRVAVRKIKGGLLFLPFLLVCGLPSALAFSSLEFYGGAYHRQITEKALQPLGVSTDSLHWLYTGNLAADKVYGELFKLKYLHFTDMSFEKSEDYLEDQLEAVAEMAGDAPEDYQSYRRTLVEFGTYLHCVQDFYSHTNWVEAHLVAGVTDIPLPPADFEDFGLELISPHTMSRMMPPRRGDRDRSLRQGLQQGVPHRRRACRSLRPPAHRACGQSYESLYPSSPGQRQS